MKKTHVLHDTSTHPYSVNTKAYNLLLQCKHIVVEEFVEFLIGVVDAELLKGVDLWRALQTLSINCLGYWLLHTHLKHLKAEDVEDSNEPAVVSSRVGARVDLTD